MEAGNQHPEGLIQDLDGGLSLRRATAADSERLSAFNAQVHRQEEKQEPDQRVGQWTKDLVNHYHPTTRAADFTIVEDLKQNKIVSTMVLISQTWSYAGVQFKVGRPELVGTDPAYRERGLVRVQFEAIHQWSAERGELVQGITGIPYYYRQFGYEMGMELGGGRSGFLQQIPGLEGEEPFSIRAAQESDLPFLIDLYNHSSQRYLVTCARDEEIWRYELDGRSPQNVNRTVVNIIQSEAGERMGYVLHPPNRWGGMMAATGYEIKAGMPWSAITPTVMRYLKSIGEAYSAEQSQDSELERFGFWLGSQHPVYEVIPDRLSKQKPPYAWYLRVPDLSKFLRLIRPVLEARLAASALAGFSGEIKLTFYKSGLRLVMEKGQLVEIEQWKPKPDRNAGDAGFPGLTFLQLVFGYRNLKEIKYAFPDCWTKGDHTAVLLEILFPEAASSVWPLS